MKNALLTVFLSIFLGGCAVSQLPNVFKEEKKENETAQKPRSLKCNENFTALTITAYKEGGKYFADLKSPDGERKHLPLKVKNGNFKKRIYEECFIAPAAWLMVTQPGRFKFFIDKNGIFQYEMNKK